MFYAHSTKRTDKTDWQALRDHLIGTGNRASNNAAPFGGELLAQTSGRLQPGAHRPQLSHLGVALSRARGLKQVSFEQRVVSVKVALSRARGLKLHPPTLIAEHHGRALTSTCVELQVVFRRHFRGRQT